MWILLGLLWGVLLVRPAGAEDLYLEYRVSWSLVPLGKIELWEKEGQAVAYAYTTGLGALILPFKSLWQTEINRRGEPLRTVIEVLERGKAKRKCLYFDRQGGRVVKEKITPQKYRREVFSASFPIFDELSGFLAVRTLDWKAPGQTHLLPVFGGKKAHLARVRFKGRKEIRTFRGREKVAEIEVALPFESELLKRSPRIRMYLSADGLPVVVKGKIPLGHLTARLQRVLGAGSAPPPPKALLHSVLKAPDGVCRGD